jgi:hypothetical protein
MPPSSELNYTKLSFTENHQTGGLAALSDIHIHEGLDLVALSAYPNDAKISALVQTAAQEANSLVTLLGVNLSSPS